MKKKGQNGNGKHHEQIDLFEARRLRDKGIEIVTDHNLDWKSRGMLLISRGLVGTGKRMTGEDIRLWLKDQGLEEPGHPNCWGALTRHAGVRGWLTYSGQTTHAADKKSHACRVPIWIFI